MSSIFDRKEKIVADIKAATWDGFPGERAYEDIFTHQYCYTWKIPNNFRYNRPKVKIDTIQLNKYEYF